jgi:hypothetical protein
VVEGVGLGVDRDIGLTVERRQQPLQPARVLDDLRRREFARSSRSVGGERTRGHGGGRA